MEIFEMFHAPERIIVSPGAGVYEPLDGPSQVAAGDVIGHITGPGQEVVAVRTPFAGKLVEMVAWKGERVVARQRIAWLRVA
jgi:hypothetical protein